MKELKAKEPLIALLLSVICTGLGQVYARRLKRGIVFFCAMSVYSIILCLYVISPTTRVNIYWLALAIFMIIFEIFVDIDAFFYAKSYNTRNNLNRDATFRRRVKIIIGVLIIFIIFNPTNLLRTYIKNNVIQSFMIPSVAMSPTLIKDDKIFVDLVVYKKSEPKRGDIVVFKYPKDPKKYFVKRLVAKGGDEIEIKDGSVLINSVKLDEPKILEKFYYYNEGVYAKEGGVVKIPEGNYYFLGDNSMFSKDSRYWGYVPKKYIVGRAYKIWFPFNRSGGIQ